MTGEDIWITVPILYFVLLVLVPGIITKHSTGRWATGVQTSVLCLLGGGLGFMVMDWMVLECSWWGSSGNIVSVEVTEYVCNFIQKEPMLEIFVYHLPMFVGWLSGFLLSRWFIRSDQRRMSK